MKQNKTEVIAPSSFEEETRAGLIQFPKRLSSKYIYDKNGDRLFQEIMAMPSYYLTRCEHEILSENTEAIAEAFNTKNGFDLIELGAGDGEKTTILLDYMVKNEYDFTYKPIDISENVLKILADKLKQKIPQLKVEPEQGEYFNVLHRIQEYNQRKKVILFLGSNIGNLLHPKAIAFLSELKATMNEGDLLFVGFDQKKMPQTIRDAYNDKTGITERFNKNLLTRINRELAGNFDVNQFLHWETYNPETGTANSFLIAKKEMNVEIKKLDLKVHFDPWETIQTEISQKYTDKVVEWIAQESGLEVIESFSDKKRFYTNYIFQ